MQRDVAIGAPLKHRAARELGAIFKANRCRQVAKERDILKDPQNVCATKRVTYFEREAFASEDRVPRSGVRATLDAGWESAGNHG